MSRKTVLQILHSLNVGGAEILAAGLARELQDQFNFVFVCLDELGELGKTLNEEGFRVEVLNRKEGFDRVCSRKLKRLYHDIGASVLHAHQYTPFFTHSLPDCSENDHLFCSLNMAVSIQICQVAKGLSTTISF
ncbi:hypothetical protein N8553_01345 [bacterium]|nr:hypothetical protein [bacterium]